MSTKGLTGISIAWLTLSAFVCAIDAGFVLLRPRTLPGGDLAVFPFTGWHLYIQYDKRYAATPLVNPEFSKLAEAYGIRGMKVDNRADVVPTVREARQHPGPVLLDFRVEQEDSVYPMVPAGADLHQMIRRPSPLYETGADE